LIGDCNSCCRHDYKFSKRESLSVEAEIFIESEHYHFF
jgi:hypothetical protein